jgi:hypothetical protein
MISSLLNYYNLINHVFEMPLMVKTIKGIFLLKIFFVILKILKKQENTRKGD